MEINEYIRYITENDIFNKTFVNKDIRMSCGYRPPEFLAVKEMFSGVVISKNINKKILENETEKFNNAVYFDIAIELANKENILTENVSDRSEYAVRLSELTYNLTRDIYIVADSKDTIRALSYNYSNSYGMSPGAKFIFVFPKKVIAGNYSSFDVIYDDKLFAVNDNIKFRFTISDLKNKLLEIKN